MRAFKSGAMAFSQELKKTEWVNKFKGLGSSWLTVDLQQQIEKIENDVNFLDFDVVKSKKEELDKITNGFIKEDKSAIIKGWQETHVFTLEYVEKRYKQKFVPSSHTLYFTAGVSSFLGIMGNDPVLLGISSIPVFTMAYLFQQGNRRADLQAKFKELVAVNFICQVGKVGQIDKQQLKKSD